MIELNENIFTATDGVNITYYETPQPANVQGIVLLVHGMAEHALRYHEFSNFLYEHHFMAVALDQRGHGKTGLESGDLGFFAPKNGWQRVVMDVKELSLLIKNAHPDLPLFLLGHSMGSVVARSCIIEFPDLYKGAVIVGTTVGVNPLMRKIGGLIASFEIKSRSEKTPSENLSHLSFGSYNKKFAPNRTTYDWLSLCEQNVDDYINDPLCGFTCSAGFYRDLFSGIHFASSFKNISKMPKAFPILFLSGGDDPVSNMGKEVKLVHRLTQKTGMTNITLKLYPKLRHEILNEESRFEIYNEILEFLNSHSNN
ncbi:alpha/beta fold hydrolase [Acetobacterium bakii]|uniref:alpha/beta fold hydrolase n=1 Tax=Acetobacterium bakii TaxID=52689 RepID=UPI000E0FC08F|nr:alpha/beta hydrolase [Acetobacterium bakii]